MIPTHLEAYEIALIAWVTVLAVFGLQGLISVWLEGRELEADKPKRASEPLAAVVAMGALALAEVFLAARLVRALHVAPEPAGTLALYASLGAFILAVMLIIYRRYFIDDEVIVGEREDGVPW